MSEGYIITNNPIYNCSEILLVFNYQKLNVVENIPTRKETYLLDYKTESNVGVWKIKKLKK